MFETLREVYRHDTHARRECLSPEVRLAYHQALMDDPETCLQIQLDERRVEPSSSLGGAIRYLQGHWGELTRFVRVSILFSALFRGHLVSLRILAKPIARSDHAN